MKQILLAAVMLSISGLAFSESIEELERRPLNMLKTLGLSVEAQKGFVWAIVPVDETGKVGKAVWSKEGEVSSEFMELAKQKIASFKRFKPKWAYAHTLAGYHEKLLKVQKQKCAAIDPDGFKRWNNNPYIKSDLIGEPLLDCLHKVSEEQTNIKVNIPSIAQFFIISEKQAMVNIAQIYLPGYPALSAENGEEGSVVMELHIAGGKVDTAKIVKSSGYSRLDKAARKAIWRLTFSKKAREDIEYYQLIQFNLGD
ncbi:energy transducer TonB [Neisseria subflava]|uniref:Energy transducer TonB n=2 Tax=Neisseria TaxID=482 RepID=A0A9X9HSI1_NEISU|nr:energy transducer TonB [Neisseria subflava]UTG68948.1 energy transducer TonB [Neisseria subflava]